jgi:cell division protein FtsI (penicillin-binding protein 3)
MIVVARLGWVQVLGAGRYAEYGDDQRIANIVIAPGRGQIYDRQEQDLAISMPAQTVVADPRLVSDPRGTAQKLAALLPAPYNDETKLYRQLTRESAFAYIARQVPDEVVDKVKAEELDGITFVEESMRINPAGELAKSVLGSVDVDNTGVSALELQYDKALKGTPGELILERDLNGRTIPAGRHHLEPAEPGEDLILTLDRNLQLQAEQIMASAVTDTGSIGGTAIISDPETGEIYALVNITADETTGVSTVSGNNMAVTAGYEPGSVNKVITLAAAIEEGLVTPDTVLDVPSSLQVADHVFQEHGHPAGEYSVTDILTQSSNVGTIMVAQQVGKNKLYDYMRSFGFGEPTALDFPAEVGGAFPKPSDWSGTSIGTIPIGQGISVTAMQMLYAYNAIGNDGVYVPPTLVKEFVDAEGVRRPATPGATHRVVSASTAEQMRAMMTNVVAEGTGEAAQIEGYRVAGKTGTARKPAPDGRGYVWPDGTTHHMATFAGFMPAEDPKLSIIVVMDEPDRVYAAGTAAPAFRELSRQALRLMRVPPPAESDPLITGDSTTRRASPAPTPDTPADADVPAETDPALATTTTTPTAVVSPEVAPFPPMPLTGGANQGQATTTLPTPARARAYRRR